MDLDSSGQSSVASAEHGELQEVLGENPQPGRLYITSERGDQILEWIEPETGQILYETPSHLQAKYSPGLRPLSGVPIMLIKEMELQAERRLYEFLVYEKLLHIILRKDLFNACFIQASS